MLDPPVLVQLPAVDMERLSYVEIDLLRGGQRLPLRDLPDCEYYMQEVLHRVYDAARYQTYFYLGRPQPRLSSEDAAWAAQPVPAA